jgi:hypothetical protein
MAVAGSAPRIPIMPRCSGGLMSGGFWLGDVALDFGWVMWHSILVGNYYACLSSFIKMLRLL